MNEQTKPNESTVLRTRLLMDRLIDKRLDEIVREAGKRVLRLKGDQMMRENQIRNVVDVAMSTESLAVVANFIRYQIGRSGGNRAWLHDGFGFAVIQDVETKEGIVYRLATEITDQLRKAVGGSDRNAVFQECRVHLVRKYLSYLNRWFYYADRTEAWDDIERATGEEWNV
jgi:hypothetical protein